MIDLMLVRTWLAPLALAASMLVACGESASDPPSPGDGDGDGDGDLDAGDVDADSQEQPELDAGVPDADVPDADVIQTTNDRCYSDDCVPSQLLPQPDLEFLEDMGGGWRRLMEADWEVAPRSEGYRCMTFTVPEDVLIMAFNPQSPLGTHHSTFGVSGIATGPDEVYACGIGVSGERRLQGSGAGTEPTELPPGVAMRLRAGEQVLMNLHLFNMSDVALRGRSGMWVKTIAESDVEHEADSVLVGPLQLFVPTGRSTQTGGCTLPHDVTVFAVGPHMHQKGVHIRASATTRGEDVEIYDGDYDFTHQLVHPIEPIELKAGDRVNVECTYENDTDAPINWGDSTLDEMCFIGLGLYPAGGFGGGPCFN